MSLVSLRSLLLVIVATSSTIGCADQADPGDPEDGAIVDGTAQAIAQSRTFGVSSTPGGCRFPYGTLFVRRGGKMTLRNDGSVPLTILVDWPNTLGEDEGALLTLAPGRSETLSVPRLQVDLFSGGRSLEFPVYCGGESDAPWQSEALTQVRIYR